MFGRARLKNVDSKMQMIWPIFYPENCPPSDAEDAEGIIFRLMQSIPPTENDLKAHVQLHPDQDFGTKHCQACGLSVYRSFYDAVRLQNRIPAYRAMRIAKADLSPREGKLLHTPSRPGASHHTWWIPRDINVENLFSIADSGDRNE
jgi:hypothetical protein